MRRRCEEAFDRRFPSGASKPDLGLRGPIGNQQQRGPARSGTGRAPQSHAGGVRGGRPRPRPVDTRASTRSQPTKNTPPCPLDNAWSVKKPVARSRSRRFPTVQIGVQGGQGKRNPLDHREMNLGEAEKSCRREREDEPNEHGTGRAQADPAPQHVGPPARTGRRRATTRR